MTRKEAHQTLFMARKMLLGGFIPEHKAASLALTIKTWYEVEACRSGLLEREEGKKSAG